MTLEVEGLGMTEAGDLPVVPRSQRRTGRGSNVRDFPRFMRDWKGSPCGPCWKRWTSLLPPLAALLAALAAGACQTGSFQPIEIDVSKRTATPSSAPETTPTPRITAPALQLTVSAPRPEATPLPAPTAAPPAALAGTPEAVVEAQLAAYNRRDVEEFAAAYAPDAVVYDPPEQIRAAGMESIRRIYAKSFAEAPSARATISQRIIQGNFVIDHESVSGLPGGRSASAVVIYEVRDGKIRRAWVLR
jgi:hypothetical protein